MGVCDLVLQGRSAVLEVCGVDGEGDKEARRR